MKDFKGTKGKWFWNESHGNKLASLQNEYGSEICNFGNDTNYYPTEGVEPDIYDKKLIASAPEMFEMLKRIEDTKGNIAVNDAIWIEMKQLLTKITE
jgi:hypothetical protein